MAEEKLLTVREASLILGVSEKEVLELSEKGALPAYKIGGVYLRFKREQVLEYKKRIKPFSPAAGPRQGYTLRERISDFFYFNDFYILTIVLIILLLVVISRGF